MLSAIGCIFPTCHSFVELESGSVVVSSVKMPERIDASNKMIVRFYETEGLETEVILRFRKIVSRAYPVDINENVLSHDCGRR